MNPYTWPRRLAAPLMYVGVLVLVLAIMLDSQDDIGPILFTPVGVLGGLVVVAVAALHFWLRRREERWQRAEDRRILGLEPEPSEVDDAVLGSPDDAEQRRLNEELDPRARPRKLWFTYQYVATCVVAVVICYVAATKLADGQDVATWSAVLIAIPLILVAWGLFLRWAIKNHRL